MTLQQQRQAVKLLQETRDAILAEERRLLSLGSAASESLDKLAKRINFFIWGLAAKQKGHHV